MLGILPIIERIMYMLGILPIIENKVYVRYTPYYRE